MPTERQNPDGSYSPAEPLPYYGWKAKVEQWANRKKLKRLASFMARWDERGL